MVVTAQVALSLATPTPAAVCSLERSASGSVEFVCGEGPALPDGSRRVLIDGVDCGRIYMHGDAVRWVGCDRLGQALDR